MARPLRIQYPGAIYHVMSRGSGRQKLFYRDDDYQRMLDGLEKTVDRTGWEVFAFVWMPNHIHLLFRTPIPNLSKGMQYLLSGYANWYAQRHHRTGHLFQGRFRGELIEDETYFWNVSRYLHLNPVRGKRPLVDHPRKWLWSSYQGYCRNTNRLDWLDYEGLFRAWQGEMGGSTPVNALQKVCRSGHEEAAAESTPGSMGGVALGERSLRETNQASRERSESAGSGSPIASIRQLECGGSDGNGRELLRSRLHRLRGARPPRGEIWPPI